MSRERTEDPATGPAGSPVEDITDRFDAATRLVVLLGPPATGPQGSSPSGSSPSGLSPSVPSPSVSSRRRAHGRLLLGDAAARLLGVERGLVSVSARCARCGGDHGVPLVLIAGRPGMVAASVSHGGGRTVVAVADRSVGIDAEPLVGVAERFSAIRAVSGGWASDAADGAEALGAWTVVESVVKADGRGLEVDPRRVTVDGRPGETRRRASIDGTRPFYAVSSAIVEGLVISLAVADDPADQTAG